MAKKSKKSVLSMMATQKMPKEMPMKKQMKGKKRMIKKNTY